MTISAPRIATIAGLGVAALGIVALMLSGANLPPVPPGLVLLAGIALLVAFVRTRWTPLLAIAIAAAEAAGVIFSGALANVIDPTAFSAFAATWLRVVGIAIAIVAGILTIATEKKPLAQQPSTSATASA